MLVIYSNIIFEIRATSSGFEFYCPYHHEWTEIEGDLLHCKNRLHQHLSLDHGVPAGTVENYPIK